MGTTIKHPVPDSVKQSFVIWTSGHSDAQPWSSKCPNVKNYKWQLNPVWHRMFYSCTRMAVVVVKGLRIYSLMRYHCLSVTLWVVVVHGCQTLLDLGSGVNYHDSRGLTPLYLCTSNSTSGTCVNLLLFNYASVGVVDSAGCTELHQVWHSLSLTHTHCTNLFWMFPSYHQLLF